MATSQVPQGVPSQGRSVRASIAVTSEPWELDVDAVVLSVGLTLGDLALDFLRQFPQAQLDEIPLDLITPDLPEAVRLRSPDEPGVGPWLAILATPHPEREPAEPTVDSVARATSAAVRTAAEAGARSIGMPVIATGAIGLPFADVAAVAVPAAMRAAASALERIVFLTPRERDVEVLDRAIRGELPLPVELKHLGGAIPRDLAGGVSSDRVDPDQVIPLSQDCLAVSPYVSMLATVVSDRTTPLPLSVGIFGEWGSGKSYFMGLLRGQIAQLKASGDPRYCSQIAEISFNAWHYADTNIWASLGDEIFRQLTEPAPSAPESRRELRAELAKRLTQRQEFEARTEDARSAAADMQARVDRASRARETRVGDLLFALRKSPTLARRTRALWRKLGLNDEVERAKLLSDQLGGVLTEAEALRRSPTDRAGKLALAGAAVILIAGAVAGVFASTVHGWLIGAAGAFMACSGTGLALLTRARSGARALRSLASELRDNLDEAARRRSAPEVERALDELRQAEAEQRVAEAQLNDVVARVGELGSQLAALEPGRRLYSFLADRAGGDVYAGNLGLISVIRKDFQQLVELLVDSRAQPSPEGEPAPIERIVLYIDDLDRCSPRQVIEVLQAVHLLLALDLFVVVVGVDPRWLLSSVRSQYPDLLTGGSALGDGAQRDCPTPEDYLEKIINIPLALPKMAEGSLGRLLSALTPEDPQAQGQGTGSGSTSSEPTPVLRSADPGLVEPGSEVSFLERGRVAATRHRELTSDERGLLAALEPLVETPRDAKRLINLYRMLRSTRDLSQASRFLGEDDAAGDYQVVAVLLGVLTAPGRLLDRFLDTPPDPALGVEGGVLRRPADTPWDRFVADLRPADGANRVVGVLRGDEAADWERLHAGLRQTSPLVSHADLSGFQRWAPRIRRFSYALSGQRTTG